MSDRIENLEKAVEEYTKATTLRDAKIADANAPEGKEKGRASSSSVVMSKVTADNEYAVMIRTLLDTDGNGKITKAELKAADADGNNKIDAAEWAKLTEGLSKNAKKQLDEAVKDKSIPAILTTPMGNKVAVEAEAPLPTPADSAPRSKIANR